MSLDWTCKHHADLTLKELYALLQLRTEVFVVEQKCPTRKSTASTWSAIPIT